MSTSAAEAVELTVSLPALNERESVEDLLPRLHAALEALGLPYDIQIVDGGSTDGTREAAVRLGARVVDQSGTGFGRALHAGFEAARGRWVLVMDADGSHPPEKIKDLWSLRERAGVVIASRFVPGGEADQPPVRYWMSRVLNAVTGVLLPEPVRDASSGFRLYRAELVKGLPLRQRDFSVQQEILAHALARGGSVAEVPFRYDKRLGGESKARPLKWLPSFARMLLRLVELRRDPQRVVLPLILLGAAAAYLAGIGFGLPSAQRSARVYLPEQRTPAFYARIEENRRSYYKTIGDNLQAAFGRGEWAGTLVPPSEGFVLKRYPAGQTPPDPVLLHAFSSFSLRSVEQDEQFVLNTIAHFKPRKLDFDPRETMYGGAYIYPLAGWWAGLHVLHALRLSPDPLSYYERPEKIAALYLWGRVLSALAGLAGVWFVFLLGAELYGAWAGLSAAALYAFSPAVVAYAHLLKPHLLASALCAAALWLAARAAMRREPRRLLAAAACYGLAVGAAKNVWPLAAALALAAWMSEDAPAGRKLGRLAGCAGVAAAAFALTNPYAFVHFGDLLDEMRAMTRWYHSSPTARAPFDAAAGPLRAGLGLGSWALLAGALGLMARRRSRADALVAGGLAAVVVLTAFQMSAAAREPGSARFFLAAIVLGCAAVGGAVAERGWRAALGLALLVNLGLAGARDLNFVNDAPGRSFADRASDWAAAAVPAGGELGFGTPAPMVDRFPPLPFSRYDLVYVDGAPDDAQAKALPERFVTNALWPLPKGLEGRYELEKTFDLGPTARRLRDPFTQANPPIAVYRRAR